MDKKMEKKQCRKKIQKKIAALTKEYNEEASQKIFAFCVKWKFFKKQNPYFVLLVHRRKLIPIPSFSMHGNIIRK